MARELIHPNEPDSSQNVAQRIATWNVKTWALAGSAESLATIQSLTHEDQRIDKRTRSKNTITYSRQARKRRRERGRLPTLVMDTADDTIERLEKTINYLSQGGDDICQIAAASLAQKLANVRSHFERSGGTRKGEQAANVDARRLARDIRCKVAGPYEFFNFAAASM